GVVFVLTLAAALVYAPMTEARQSRRVFLEKVKARIGDAELADYGGTNYAANWACERTVVRRLEDRPDDSEEGEPVGQMHAAYRNPVQVRHAAEAFLAATPGPVYLVVDREHLAAQGLPKGTAELMDDGRE